MKDCQAVKSSPISSKVENSVIADPDCKFKDIFLKGEEFSPQPPKALHVESKTRKPLPRKESREVLTKIQAELLLDKMPSSSKFIKFLQRVCKILRKENEELRKKLTNQMIKVQAKYGVEESPDFLLEHSFDF